MDAEEALIALHEGLPRAGPGLAEDVAWAAHVSRLRPDGRVCDAGCGTGGDLAALRRAVPQGRVDGIERSAVLAATARDRAADDPAITVIEGDMARIGGPYDLIWSAGAVYFLGIEGALGLWRRALAPEGAVVFSHPTLWDVHAAQAARDFWGGYDVETEADHRARIAAAGYGVIDTKRVTETGWLGYYGPLLARCDALEEGAGPDLAAAIADTRAEAAAWREVSGETGYLLLAVRPI